MKCCFYEVLVFGRVVSPVGLDQLTREVSPTTSSPAASTPGEIAGWCPTSIVTS